MSALEGEGVRRRKVGIVRLGRWLRAVGFGFEV